MPEGDGIRNGPGAEKYGESSDMRGSFKRFYAELPFRGSRLRIHGIGIREPMPPSLVNRPTGTGDYLLMYFHTEIQAGWDEQAGWHPPGALCLWRPGEGQFYGDEKRPFLHSWLHAEGSMVDRFAQSAPEEFHQLESPAPFEAMLAALAAEAALGGAADEIIAENLFENWTRDFLRRRPGAAEPVPPRLAAVRDHIDSRFAEPLALAALARMAGWSIPHFSERFRECFGASPIDYVIRQRIHHASYLLSDLNLSVAEIAARVGYEDVFHFSKLFKRHSGASPRRRRAQLLAERGEGAMAGD